MNVFATDQRSLPQLFATQHTKDGVSDLGRMRNLDLLIKEKRVLRTVIFWVKTQSLSWGG